MGSSATWLGPKGDKYADRFVFNLDQLEAHWKRTLTPEGRRAPLERVLEGVPRDISVLEVGCNVGNQLLLLKDMGFKLRSGIELNPRTASMARRRGFDVLEGNACQIPFKGKSFDMLFTCWCLSHLDDKELEMALGELVRVSRKWICISEAWADRPHVHTKDYLWLRPWSRILEGMAGVQVIEKATVRKGTGLATELVLAELT